MNLKQRDFLASRRACHAPLHAYFEKSQQISWHASLKSKRRAMRARVDRSRSPDDLRPEFDQTPIRRCGSNSPKRSVRRRRVRRAEIWMIQHIVCLSSELQIQTLMYVNGLD